MRFLPFRGFNWFPCLLNSESASPSREQSVPAQPTLRQQNRSFIFLPDLPSLRLSGHWDTNRADTVKLGKSDQGGSRDLGPASDQGGGIRGRGTKLILSPFLGYARHSQANRRKKTDN